MVSERIERLTPRFVELSKLHILDVFNSDRVGFENRPVRKTWNGVARSSIRISYSSPDVLESLDSGAFLVFQ